MTKINLLSNKKKTQIFFFINYHMKIFLIIFDTLRKDHTGKTYGNDWIKTPNFDKFAKGKDTDRFFPGNRLQVLNLHRCNPHMAEASGCE